MNGKIAEKKKTDKATDRDNGQEFPSGITEGGGRRDEHREGKRRRRQARERDEIATLLTNLLLQVFEARLPRDLLDPGLAQLPRNEIQEEYAAH